MAYENAGETTDYILTVPDLKVRPEVSDECCAMPAATLIEEFVGKVDFVDAVSASSKEGAVLVSIKGASDARLADIRSRIGKLGYEVTEAREAAAV